MLFIKGQIIEISTRSNVLQYLAGFWFLWPLYMRYGCIKHLQSIKPSLSGNVHWCILHGRWRTRESKTRWRRSENPLKLSTSFNENVLVLSKRLRTFSIYFPDPNKYQRCYINNKTTNQIRHRCPWTSDLYSMPHSIRFVKEGSMSIEIKKNTVK